MNALTRQRLQNRLGKTFHFLTILAYAGTNRHREILVECRCRCGNITIVPWKRIFRGSTKSCGCYKKIHARTHGMSNSPLYHVWECIHNRCYNTNNTSYKRYGGRGIHMCESWKNSFEAFFHDMGTTYKRGLTIDRIDNDGDYTPENCRWVTIQENLMNSSHIRWITIDGQTRFLKDWQQHFGVSSSLYQRRIKKGMTAVQALMTPVASQPTRLDKPVTIGEQTLTIGEWLTRAGIGVETFRARYGKQHWPLVEALTRPTQKYHKRECPQ